MPRDFETAYGSYVQGSTAMLRTVAFDRAVGPAPVTGYYAVDLDQLPQLRTDLEGVQDIYREIYNESLGLRDITAPGLEEASTAAAQALSRTSGDEPGQLGWCAQQAYDVVGRMISEVDAILLTYRNAEDANVMGP